jgi:hypothetical protein
MMRGRDDLELARDGAERIAHVLGAPELGDLAAACDRLISVRPGGRVFGEARVQRLCRADGAIGRLARAHLPDAFPVRGVIFDKTPANNWLVAWHQDRTIAVKRRLEVEGFGPWSTKSGLQHVEPLFAVLEGMLTLRLHIDDCGADNAPLLIAPGSHRLGRIPADEAVARAAALGVEPCLAEAGDVWIYATPILHASEPARVPGRRRVLQVDFAATGLPGGLEWAGI